MNVIFFGTNVSVSPFWFGFPCLCREALNEKSRQGTEEQCKVVDELQVPVRLLAWSLDLSIAPSLLFCVKCSACDNLPASNQLPLLHSNCTFFFSPPISAAHYVYTHRHEATNTSNKFVLFYFILLRLSTPCSVIPSLLTTQSIPQSLNLSISQYRFAACSLWPAGTTHPAHLAPPSYRNAPSAFLAPPSMIPPPSPKLNRTSIGAQHNICAGVCLPSLLCDPLVTAGTLYCLHHSIQSIAHYLVHDTLLESISTYFG